MANVATQIVKQQWKTYNVVTSLPQMNLSDFEEATQISNHRIVGHYHDLTLMTALQPIFSIDHQRIIGHEALIRAQNKQNKPISPIDLFQLAESEEDKIYLDRLCRYIHAANFHTLSHQDNWLFINVSAEASVKGRNYGLFFSHLLKKYNIKPSNVVVEIIEDPSTDNEKLLEAAKYYKNMGCLLAIDDFGAGHSNFERVWNLQPDIVKLDRSLLTRALTSKNTQNMINSLVDLLHQAGCLVIVEGVEDEQQALIAMNSGADFVQGYYFAKPTLDFESIGNKTSLFRQLSKKFIANEQQKIQQEHQSTEDYCQAFRAVVVNLQQGLSLNTASQPFTTMKRSIRCFLLNNIGDQIGTTLIFNDSDNVTSSKFIQLKISENANWYRKHYVKGALQQHSRIYVSSPYRSITGDGLCITISMSFNIKGKQHILCFDIQPAT